MTESAATSPARRPCAEESPQRSPGPSSSSLWNDACPASSRAGPGEAIIAFVRGGRERAFNDFAVLVAAGAPFYPSTNGSKASPGSTLRNRDRGPSVRVSQGGIFRRRF
jgi:hypothetical protein